MKKHNKALVTACFGDKYMGMYNEYCKNNWQKYADKHGLDVVVVKDFMDKSSYGMSRPLYWQKLLVLEHEDVRSYDQVVFMDTDIVINVDTAPNVFDAVAPNRIAAVESYSNPSKDIYKEVLARMYAFWEKNGQPYIDNKTGREFYEKYGFENPPDDVIQTGVFVISPHHHTDFMRHVYENYEEKPHLTHESRPLSYEVVKSGLVHWLDCRFNYVLSDQLFYSYEFLLDGELFSELKPNYGESVCNYIRYRLFERFVKQMYDNSYFLHFAGWHMLMKYLPKHVCAA